MFTPYFSVYSTKIDFFSIIFTVQPYQRGIHACCDKKVINLRSHDCCQNKPYDRKKQVCCHGKLSPFDK